MTGPNPVEMAADDLLLLFDRIETPGVSVPEFAEIGRTVSAHVTEALPALSRYLTRAHHNKMRERDVEFGFGVAVDALTPAAVAHAALAARLLAWSSERTGLSHAEVLRDVSADPDDEGHS